MIGRNKYEVKECETSVQLDLRLSATRLFIITDNNIMSDLWDDGNSNRPCHIPGDDAFRKTDISAARSKWWHEILLWLPRKSNKLRLRGKLSILVVFSELQDVFLEHNWISCFVNACYWYCDILFSMVFILLSSVINYEYFFGCNFCCHPHLHMHAITSN